MHDLSIKAVLNGWTVKVGCQTMVYSSLDALITDLREYLTDPEAKEKAVRQSAINKRILANQLPEPTLSDDYYYRPRSVVVTTTTAPTNVCHTAEAK